MMMDGLSMDIEKMNMEKLKAVFPECFSENKLDIDKLLSLCGEYIDNDFEKYKFEWKGKAECLRLAQKRSTGTLRPCPEESVNFETTQNLYIEGDNLEVLKLLQTAYNRKVKMIYIDPPYNTGNDFVYADNFADPIARYKEVTQQTTKSNPETMGRYHTNWLNMMYPRLRLAANLLRDDGVIFISIDDNEVTNLRKLCDEVFGEENFVAEIVWERSYAPINMVKHFSKSHDYILCYAKNIDNLVCNGLPRPESTNSKYANPDNDPRGLWRTDNMSVGPVIEEKVYEIVTPSGRKCLPPKGRCWLYTKERYHEMVADNRIWFGEDGNNVPAPKRFLAEVKQGLTPMTIWKYTDVGHTQDSMRELRELFNGEKVFDYSKPVDLIKRCIHLYTSANDIILDFFSGSATTAHAVMQLNAEDEGKRQFIMVQLPELCEEKSEAYKAGYKNICEIGKERIRRAGKQLLVNREQLLVNREQLTGNSEPEEQAIVNREQLTVNSEQEEPTVNCNLLPVNCNLLPVNSQDFGFKVFKLDTSNLKTWDATPIEEDNLLTLYNRMNGMIHRVKPDRTDLDMVYEIMLKLGVPLTYPVKKIELIANKQGEQLLVNREQLTGNSEQEEQAIVNREQLIVNSEQEEQAIVNREQLTGNNEQEEPTVNCNLLPVTYHTPSVTCFSVGEDCLLLICLAENVQPEDVEAMAEYAPAKIIISRDSFADDTAMSNAYYILRDREIELKLI